MTNTAKSPLTHTVAAAPTTSTTPTTAPAHHNGTAIIKPRNKVPPVQSYDARGLLQEHHDPILISEVEAAQPWSSLRPEIDHDYTLVERFTPWEAVFDLSTLQGGDTIQLSVHLLFTGPNIHQGRWVLSERHEVRIQIDPDNTSCLNIDGVAQPRGRVLAVAPLTGPWPARLTYRQVAGFAQTVRFLLTR